MTVRVREVGRHPSVETTEFGDLLRFQAAQTAALCGGDQFLESRPSVSAFLDE